jgi:putative Mg2+ transporter-C (MgtC) family protein
MGELWRGVVQDFSDLPSGEVVVRVAVRLLVAAVLGGLLGLERELRGKEAGLRTHMLLATGAALFTVLPQQAGMGEGAVSRVLQGLVAGVGFLGGGAILKQSQEGHVRGLTTAAGLWLTAAVGMAAGLGRGATALLAALLALVILELVGRVELRLSPRKHAPDSGPAARPGHGLTPPPRG